MRSIDALRLMFLAGLLLCASAFAAPMTEQQKIQALIHGVEVLPGAKFIRNGSSYDGKQAADHLRMKLNYAGDRIRTAEQFIHNIAAGSSTSGQPYQIELADGRRISSAAFFEAELKRLEAPPPPASPPASSASAASPSSPPASAASPAASKR